ncbi:GPO family capsid scaffolding protein, partial [Zobellella denitrificans]|uniref:GPO family capsid scaffolding protein n=1 Tax=Zobellella denitrificans TaxID=347534 RepID=UPI00115CC5F0
MKPDSRLRTGWICIATEGNSVDGRFISREWLTDMAETYDPDHYTAVIWPDHDKWQAMGTVEALKAEQVDGKMKLFAILRPTRDLIYYNQLGQYQFCSIEPLEQFAGGDKTYLGGLGVTDMPASTGTTRMQFSAKDKAPKLIGESQPLSLAELADREQEAGMFKKFMAWFKTQESAAPQEPTPEDPAMDKEQFNELKGLIGGYALAADTDGHHGGGDKPRAPITPAPDAPAAAAR